MTDYVDIPPPPGGPVDVEPPPWGWRGDVQRLTAGEAGTIRKLLGASLDENPLGWAMYAAVAFARRLDRDRYPWELAERLELGDVTGKKKSNGDDQDDQDDDDQDDQDDDDQEEPDPT